MIKVSNSFAATNANANRSQKQPKARDNKRQFCQSTRGHSCEAESSPTRTILEKPKRFGDNFRFLLFMALAVSVLALYCEPHMLSDFITQHMPRCMSTMHNKLNYCDRNVNLNGMFGRIQARVLHQAAALRQLELAMRRGVRARAISLVGSSGVGKSLTARLLREHYPWPENVQLFQWNTLMRDKTHKYQRVRAMIAQMSTCGRNLLIIDNMTPCDHEFVAIINRLIMSERAPETTRSAVENFGDNIGFEHTNMIERVNTVMHANVDITILYIFNMNKMLSSAQYDLQHAQLQQLADTTVINYRTFGRVEFADCIRHELMAEHMFMAKQHFDDIVSNTAVSESGCKTAHSKVQIAGEYESRLVEQQLEKRLGKPITLNCD